MEGIVLTSCETAVGWVGIARSAPGLLALILPQPTEEAALRPLIERWGLEGIAGHSILDDLKARLRRYFGGEDVFFDDHLDPTVGTPFQRRVWAATREIPYGETRSYRWVACRIGSPGAARAVGQALAANPFPIVVPCHRVVRSDGSLGGFGDRPELKRRLLEMEEGPTAVSAQDRTAYDAHRH